MSQKSFRDAFGVLQHHSESLRNQREPNIDDLLTIVKESVAAYTVCKERIDAVEMALEQALSGTSVEKVPPPARPAEAPDDEDIPF